jgi:hypothetical protein
MTRRTPLAGVIIAALIGTTTAAASAHPDPYGKRQYRTIHHAQKHVRAAHKRVAFVAVMDSYGKR